MTKNDWPTITECLAEEGLLHRNIPDFQPRIGQLKLAQSIGSAIEHEQTLLAESGTGTGKTYAYLIPVLLSGKRTILSTGTRHLQEQLYHRDLPQILRNTPASHDIKLLKGRSNYLCIYRLEQRANTDSGLNESHGEKLRELNIWRFQTLKGDIAEISWLTENSALYRAVTSTADNCLGSKCPSFDQCFVYQNRKEALQAGILVINHHLFFADLVLQNDGITNLLPGVETLIFDEAHQLPEIAFNFMGETISARQFHELARDVIVESISTGADSRAIRQCCEHLMTTVQKVRTSLGASEQRRLLSTLQDNKTFQQEIGNTCRLLDELIIFLEPLSAGSDAIQRCQDRSVVLRERLDHLHDRVREEDVQWFETSQRSFKLHNTPLTAGETIQELFSFTGKARVFLSATLSVAGKFDYFRQQLGLQEAESLTIDSPFDYDRQALLLIPDGLPDPQASNFVSQYAALVLPIINAAKGRCFLLFTSYRHLHAVHRILKARCAWPLLMQGSETKHQMLDRFRKSGQAVLLGTYSFWEGVDVRGPALSCVIIDKLPFSPPDDPLLQARSEQYQRLGKNPFMEFQVPTAVLGLKQGLGRLIRDTTDRGLMVVTDQRLLTRGYGKKFLRSLPGVPVTQDIERAIEFLRKL